MSADQSAASAAAPQPPFNRRWQLAALIAGFTLFLISLAAALLLTMRTEQIRAQGRHHSDVLNATRDLMGALLECESGQRGFVLTHDQRYLEPYYVARVTMKSVSRDLATLTRNEPDQSARVAALAPIIDGKIGELEHTVDLEEHGDHARALAIVKGDNGRQLMAQLRDFVAAINSSAQAGLNHARAQLDTNALLLRTDIIASILIGLALLTIVGSTRTRLLRDLSRQNTTLEERVRERTAILETRTQRVETLMQDMSHRIGNSLSLVTGFLDLQARASKSEDVKSALAAARQRVFSIASAQRRMRLAMDSDTVETVGFFDALIEDFRNALPDHRISIVASIAPGSLPSQDAIAFGIVLNELIANAIKHAWNPSDQGELDVRFTFEQGARVLMVKDDGRGHVREDTTGGLGQILIQSLIQSLHGEIKHERVRDDVERPGLRVTVRAPV